MARIIDGRIGRTAEILDITETLASLETTVHEEITGITTGIMVVKPMTTLEVLETAREDHVNL